MIFKLLHNGKELDTDPDTYFEMTKGTIFDAKAGLLNIKYSSNIDLPATRTNIEIFKAHRLLGGTASVFRMIAFFGSKSFLADVQLVSFDDDKIVIYIAEMPSKVDRLNGVTMNGVLQSSTSGGWVETDSGIVPTEIKDILGISTGGGSMLDFVDVFCDSQFADTVIFSNYLPRPLIVPDAKGGAGATPSRVVWSGGAYVEAISDTGGWINFEYPNTPPFAHHVYDVGENHESFKITDELIISRIKIEITRQPWEGGVTNYKDATAIVGIYKNTDRTQLIATIGSVFMLATDTRKTITADIDVEPNIEYAISITFDQDNIPGEESSFWIAVGMAGTQPISDGTDFGLKSIMWNNTPVLEFIKSLALENGQYLSIGEDDKIKFVDLPSIDTGLAVSLSGKYIGNRGVTVGGGGLKGRNNLIQYSKNLDGQENFINIKVDEQRIDNRLEEVSVFRKLVMSKERSDHPFTGNESASHVMTVGGGDLLTSLPKYQIYADIYAMPRMYSIEFTNLPEVPSGVFHVEQLNAMFVPATIVETTKNKQIVKCFKLLQQ